MRGLAVLIVLFVAGCGQGNRDLPDLGALPEFALVDHHNRPFTRADLAGKVTVANFVFTRCETVCPVVTLRMQTLQKDTAGMADALQLVSFSVDPEHDTPAVLAEYAREAGAEPRWRFVTGDPGVVQPLLDKGFKVPMDLAGQTERGAPNVIHSEHFVLVDRQGVIRGYYESSEETRMRSLMRDLRSLLR